MGNKEKFISTINEGYTFKEDNVKIGVGILEGEPVPEAGVFLPFKTMNRHGLIAGATGTGKTKTLQILAEILSDNSVPVMMIDIKGDLSGIGAKGSMNDKITERYKLLNIEYVPEAYPVEFLSLSDEKGTRLRATVSEFGPILLSKILGLNDTQSSIVSIIFKYCDDNKLPLVDLKDFIKVLQYATNESKTEIEKLYGKISTTSTGTILRKVVELQQQGADLFFGAPTFEVEDLMRISDDGRGMINILRVTDMQSRPKLFSTFLLQMLDELYASFPEEGDLDKPKLVMFIDEAHLLFDEGSRPLLDKIESIIKLIRSKGIGIYFCTQNPQDVPSNILSQLGLKIQHALRAFTAADRKTIKTASENFPITEFYKTEDLLTQMGIGEAFVSVLNEKGIPSPLVHTLLISPRSRMDILTDGEITNIVNKSRLAHKYNDTADPESAHEILTQKLEQATNSEVLQKEQAKEAKQKMEKGFFDQPIVKSAMRTATTTITGYVARSLLGALGLGGKRRR